MLTHLNEIEVSGIWMALPTSLGGQEGCFPPHTAPRVPRTPATYQRWSLSPVPAAPSKAPSLTSLILLLLRFLERGGGVGQDRRRQGITAPKVRIGWWGA